MFKKKEKSHNVKRPSFKKYLMVSSLLIEVTMVVMKIIEVVRDEEDDPFVIR